MSDSYVRMTAVAALAVIAGSAFAACGDGGDSSGAASSEEERVRETIARMGAELKQADGEAACALMTPAARREYARIGRGLAALEGDVGSGFAKRGGAGTCAATLAATMTAGGLVEDLNPRILSVEVRGHNATILAKSKHDPKPQRATLVREGGRWKVAKWYEN